MTCPRGKPRFMLAALGAAVLASWSIPASAETLRVRTIRVSEASGDTAVVIAASARPTFTTWKLEQPARVVVELSGARLGDIDVPLDAGTYAVGLISANVTEDDSAGPRTRIVLTLRQAADYRVETKGNDITLRVVPRVHPAAHPDVPSLAEVKQAQEKAQEQAQSEARARLKAEANAKLEAEAKTQALAQAKADALAKVDAEAKADAEALAKAEALAQAKAEKQATIRALAKADALALAHADAQARADAQAKLAAEAKAEADASAKAQRQTEAKLHDEAKERQAAQARAEERERAETAARAETDRLRKELAESQRETAKARAEASAAGEENQRQRLALATTQAQVKQAEKEAQLARSRAEAAESAILAAQAREKDRDRALQVVADEVSARQKSLDEIAQRQEAQQSQLAAAEHLVGERESAVHASEAKLAEREKDAKDARVRRDSLARDASAKLKSEAAAALAVAERERKEAAKAAELSRKELLQAVSARKQEEERKSRQADLRKQEEQRLGKAIALRKAEEQRLAEARAEHARLSEARSKLEAERNELESTRGQLVAEVERLKKAAKAEKPAPENKNTVAVAKISAPNPVEPAKPAPVVAQAAPTTKPAPVVAQAAPAAKPAPVVAQAAPTTKPAAPVSPSTKPVLADSGTAAPARPHSITLRSISHIRAIDFVDEPSRASVIIDVDENATFTIERKAGRKLSLRIEHSDLPESLQRNLDASEYLGPVNIISSYRDPAARGTVRIDVELAEDVPNRVRTDGNRIFWDFQKAQAKAPSLPAFWAPPSHVLFVPASKVAGYVVAAKEGLWTAQVPPFLVPPGQQSSSSAPSASSSTQPSSAPGQPGSPSPPGATGSDSGQAGGGGGGGGGGAGPTGRFATLGKKRYTGRRIDLDFKGADIHNILRLLADVGQVNVIVADDVKGEVTIKMRDVPWDQALDVVLRSKGLGSVREGNLLRVAPLPMLEKELEAEIARQKQIADVIPVETRLIGVSYAEASHLQDRARDLLTPRGKISVDTRTNTLIVSDVTKSLQLIEDLVRNLDTQTAQVVIETRIVEAQSSFAKQIGVQWGGTAFADSSHGNPTGLVFPYNVGIGGGADDASNNTSGLVPGPRTGTGTTGNPNYLVNMPAAVGTGSGSAIGLTLGSVSGAFNINLRLSAMESSGQVRILSSPRVTTLDNIEARIAQGTSIPVSVTSAMGANTTFVDAQLSLIVKPHITNEGTISMMVTVTNNAPNFANTSANGTPTIDKKETKTTMLVRDGDTAVIGGIYTRTSGLTLARVPFFSDIPVLGWFFRNRKETDNRSEFLVFITPRIVNRSRSAGQ